MLALEGAQGFPKSNLLPWLQMKVEVFGSLKDEDDGGAKVELPKVLTLPHGDALLVAVRNEAEVIVGALAVPGAVCVQVLEGEKGW